MPMPEQIIGLGKREVKFVWEEGRVDTWPAWDLRDHCRCAHCKSEATGEKILDSAAIPKDIYVTEMSIVGRYGLSIHFSDGHSTGIYRFTYLFEMGSKTT